MRKKHNKNGHKRFKIETLAVLCLVLTVFLDVGVNIIFGEINNTLAKQVQDKEREIHRIQMENDAVSVEVNTLNTKERVAGIAAEDGLSLDQDNIITITKSTIEGE